MRLPSNRPLHQRGTTLLIALVFLVILTLFAVSGMNTGVVNLRTANNAQMMVEAEFAAQQQIEQVFSSAASFHLWDLLSPPATPPAASTTTNVDINGDSVTDFQIVTSRARCLNVREVPGEYSEKVVAEGGAPREHYWEVVATTTDSVFGTSATVRQGVRIRLWPNYLCVP